MVRIDSEWDIGYGDMVFPSREDAINRLRNDPNVKELCREYGFENVEKMIAEGLISFQNLLLG